MQTSRNQRRRMDAMRQLVKRNNRRRGKHGMNTPIAHAQAPCASERRGGASVHASGTCVCLHPSLPLQNPQPHCREQSAASTRHRGVVLCCVMSCRACGRIRSVDVGDERPRERQDSEITLLALPTERRQRRRPSTCVCVRGCAAFCSATAVGSGRSHAKPAAMDG